MQKIYITFIIIVKLLHFNQNAYASCKDNSLEQHIIENYQVIKSVIKDLDSSEIIEAIAPELPEENQLELINLGKQVLENIINNRDLPTITLPAIEKIPCEIKKSTAFHKDGENTPTAWARWWFVKDDPIQQEYLAKIVSLSWALYDLAKSKGEAFPRGSFTIIDPDHRIYAFLLNYVSYVNNCTAPAQLPWILTSSNFAYRRDPDLMGSSHHRGQTEDSQFGIDIRFRSYETVYGFLPNINRHILFGKLNIPRSPCPLTFIKFEPVGLGSTLEVAAHALNYAQSGAVEEEARREKDIPDEIISTFKSLVPSRQAKSRLKIYEMLNHVNFKISRESRDIFVRVLKKYFPKDSEDLFYIRTGNEVILDLKSLLF
ncbi:MAG TPA: hypothetical protein VNJ29_00700 [Candidatus Nitrosotenuis sp.]|jgi:hypothetical protein|nr:hypothetical protein [Candidatus Nitrosotenuis sp.]